MKKKDSSILNHGQGGVTYQLHPRSLQRACSNLNSDRCCGRTRQEDTSTAPATGTLYTLPAGASGPLEAARHAGSSPRPPRLARSRRPLAAQAEEEGQEEERRGRPPGSGPRGKWGLAQESAEGGEGGGRGGGGEKPRSSSVDATSQECGAGAGAKPKSGQEATLGLPPAAPQTRRGGVSRELSGRAKQEVPPPRRRHGRWPRPEAVKGRRGAG